MQNVCRIFMLLKIIVMFTTCKSDEQFQVSAYQSLNKFYHILPFSDMVVICCHISDKPSTIRQ